MSMYVQYYHTAREVKANILLFVGGACTCSENFEYPRDKEANTILEERSLIPAGDDIKYVSKGVSGAELNVGIRHAFGWWYKQI